MSFKSCPRVGGICCNSGRVLGALHVSSRAPVWGASPSGFRIIASNGLFQVVPPCGGHPEAARGEQAAYRVSSRAPVWGASGAWERVFEDITGFKSCPRVGGISDGVGGLFRPQVSSRAPVWGASSNASAVLSEPSLFQVVPPCGGHQVARGEAGRV